MIPKLTTALIAGALAVSTPLSPAQAQADGADAAKIVGGLIALYAITRVIKDSRDDHTVHVTPVRPQPPRKVIPDRCFRTLNKPNGGVARGFGARCLERHVHRPHRLPQACVKRVRTDHGFRTLYRGRCLREHGWIRQSRLQ